VTGDLMVFAAHGLFGTACVTGLTVQSTLGVQSTHAVAGEIVADTLTCLNADLPPAGIKIGMVSTADNVSRISAYLTEVRRLHSTSSSHGAPVVLDPLVRSSSGRELLDATGVIALREKLIPLVDWITPNLEELSLLVGERVGGNDDVPRVCQALQKQVAEAGCGRRIGIFATGGHMEPPDDFLLTPAGEGTWLPGERVITRSTHGTGCALSSAFLSRLVLGSSPHEAALAAKSYVVGAMRNAVERGAGHGPMNYLWPLVRQSS
jgi:hydroxymethylpyrimidine/phosphomethylpyrimidine kinase